MESNRMVEEKEVQRQAIRESMARENTPIQQILGDKYHRYRILAAKALTKDSINFETLTELMSYFFAIRQSDKFSEILSENQAGYNALVHKVVDHYFIQPPNQ